MPKRRRYFSEDDFEHGITPSRLKRVGKAKQREYILHWFREHFEDPANETPYNSEEGGYLYIWGGPYDAQEQLVDEFGSLVSYELIEELAEELESEGVVDWAPGRRHADHARAQEEWDAEQAEDEEALPDLDPIIRMLESGQSANYQDANEREQRQRALSDVAALQKALIPLAPAHGGIGHNNPPPDDDAPQVEAVTEIREAASTIEQELRKENPDALAVAKSASRLKKLMGWVGGRATAAVDKVIAALLIDAGGGSPLLRAIWSAVKSVSEWLVSVAPWPF